jgi:uncharacterized protein (DUF4415 family)
MSTNFAETLKTRNGREFRLNTPEEDAAITTAALSDPDAQPMTDKQLARLRPAREALSPVLYAALTRKTEADHPAGSTRIRLDADVLEGLKATGKGWQTRMNDALREWLARSETT